MLDRLVRRGYVTRNDGDRYSLTLKLFGLAQLLTIECTVIIIVLLWMSTVAALAFPSEDSEDFEDSE